MPHLPGEAARSRACAERRAHPKGACSVRQYVPWLIVGGVLAVLIAVGLLVWFSVAGWWPIVLDITIIVTCIVSLLLR